MKTNVSLVEGLARLVITMLLAMLAVYTEWFIFMVVAMLVLSTALSQYCPLKHLLKIDFFNKNF